MWWWAGALLSVVRKTISGMCQHTKKTCFTLPRQLRNCRKEEPFLCWFLSRLCRLNRICAYQTGDTETLQHYTATQHFSLILMLKGLTSVEWLDVDVPSSQTFTETLMMHTQHVSTQSTKCSSIILKNVKHDTRTRLFRTAQSSKLISS